MNSLPQEMEGLKQVVQGLEKIVWEWALEQGKKALKAMWEAIDKDLVQEHGGGLTVEHVRPVTYTTLLGNISVKRRHCLDKATGKYCHPLDELLGMGKKDHVTRNARQRILKLAAMMSFRQSEEILEDTPINLSHQGIWNQVKKAAEPHLEERDKRIKHFLETGELPESEGKKVTNLVTEGDGVMLSLQREKTRRAEVKVGIAYEGWEQIGKERYKTLNKSIYGDIACSEEYWAGMTLKLYQKYDMAAPERVVLGGDGAEWVKEGLNWVGGRFQLDRYHLNRELRTALGPDNETIKLVRQACSEGDVGKACQLLSEAEKKTRGDQAKKIEKARHYLMKNESGLRDYRLDLGEEAKGLRRTGAMEGNVDKLVVKRMKGQGMSWTIKGCRRMLWVRFHWLEGTLKESLGPPIQTVLPIGRTTGLMTRKVKHIIDKTLTENPGNWLNMKLPALYGPHCSRPWALVLKSLAQGKI